MEQVDVIDGSKLYHMLRYAFTSLSYNENYLNEINTFPVSDSDTGTNMKRTLRKGIASTSENLSAGELFSTFASNMSMDSRGNSGFILSQYFVGLSQCLKGKEVITLKDFINACVHAYDVAYAAVVNPMEGTMLTVMREGTLLALKKLDNENEKTFEKFFKLLSETVFECTLNTKSQMNLLKSKNVVDSGALGFYLVVDGMKKYFDNDQPYFNCEKSTILPKKITDSNVPLTFFRYCTEFSITLRERHSKQFFMDILKDRGDSVVLAVNKNVLKVHIHTNVPEAIINRFKEFGTINFTKIDDLYQTQQFDRLFHRKHSDYAVVCFTYGDQLGLLFERLGADAGFPIPKGHLPTEEEMKNLLEPYLNGNLIIYSSDKSIEDLLKSMSWWGHYSNIFVVECRGIANTFFKLASSMFDGNFNDFKKHYDVLSKIKTLEIDIDKNDDLSQALEFSLSKNKLEGYSTLVAFGGKDITTFDIDTITSYMSDNDDIEFSYFQGGQVEPYIIIGAM